MKRKILWIAGIVVVLLLLPLLAATVAKARRPRVAAELFERSDLASEPSKVPGYVVRVTWTGVAGVRIESEVELVVPVDKPRTPQPVTTILVDPYVTRHGWAEFARRLDSDDDTAAKLFPRADGILVSHAHHDHLADAVGIAQRTGAYMYANRTACAFARAMGVRGDHCIIVHDQEHLRFGNADVEVVESAHARQADGTVRFGGELERPPARQSPYVWQLLDGGTLAFIVRVNGRIVYVQGSAGLTDHQLERVKDLRPDLALVSVALRENTPQYEERLLRALNPRRVAAIHWDDFFGTTLADDMAPLSGVNLPAFEAKVSQLLGPDALLRLKPFQAQVFSFPTKEELAKWGWSPPVPYP
jgi:L-ascorbate metabolism protein UlaG (beta-lactamase superfamily)